MTAAVSAVAVAIAIAAAPVCLLYGIILAVAATATAPLDPLRLSAPARRVPLVPSAASLIVAHSRQHCCPLRVSIHSQ